jgi:hypothetical protein
MIKNLAKIRDIEWSRKMINCGTERVFILTF